MGIAKDILPQQFCVAAHLICGVEAAPSIVQIDVAQPIQPAIGTPAGKRADFGERLRELHALHQEGILSDEEYAREKAEALDRN